jgi:beta-glucanase (GH16 family)
VSDTQQLSTPEPPTPEPTPNRRRAVIIVLAVVAVVALVGVVVVAVRATSGSSVIATPATQRPLTTTPPAEARSQDEAAVQGNWPLIADDEFNGTELDKEVWHPYTGKTTDGVGRHLEDNLSVGDGRLTITGRGKTSGGLSWDPGQMYGRWEVRARSQPGTGYGPVLLLWPDAENWPVGGEIDFLEIPKGDRKVNNFTVHYGPDNSQNGVSQTADFSQWHNYAVEWTPDHIAGFLDGKEIFRTTDKAQLPPGPMHLGIQQDIGPYGTDWIPAPDDTTPETVKFQIDWVRIYSL